MLLRFNNYFKSSNQTINQIIFDLRKLRNEIYNLDSFNTLNDLFIIIIIMNAYKKKKYNTIKYVLKINNNLITKIIIKYLRNVE